MLNVEGPFHHHFNTERKMSSHWLSVKWVYEIFIETITLYGCPLKCFKSSELC